MSGKQNIHEKMFKADWITITKPNCQRVKGGEEQCCSHNITRHFDKHPFSVILTLCCHKNDCKVNKTCFHGEYCKRETTACCDCVTTYDVLNENTGQRKLETTPREQCQNVRGGDHNIPEATPRYSDATTLLLKDDGDGKVVETSKLKYPHIFADALSKDREINVSEKLYHNSLALSNEPLCECSSSSVITISSESNTYTTAKISSENKKEQQATDVNRWPSNNTMMVRQVRTRQWVHSVNNEDFPCISISEEDMSHHIHRNVRRHPTPPPPRAESEASGLEECSTPITSNLELKRLADTFGDDGPLERTASVESIPCRKQSTPINVNDESLKNRVVKVS